MEYGSQGSESAWPGMVPPGGGTVTRAVPGLRLSLTVCHWHSASHWQPEPARSRLTVSDSPAESTVSVPP